MFVNLEAGDLHLKAGSPAIDAGSSEHCPRVDLEGGGRPTGRGCDIRAYEYAAAPTTVTMTTAWPTTTQPTTTTTATQPETTTKTVTQPTTQTVTVTKPFTTTQPPTTGIVTETVTYEVLPQQKPEEYLSMLWLLAGLVAGGLIVAASSLAFRR
ncbi:MAG: hypothetical protein B9J98_00170 [Candidatus Terraquivivens tikiterensis]|uniref:Uncharacterized protein n=1 Tax=Candidatus Terraquivivens tikiterensis TaxID=1980982 RepID=A0A2R7YBN0_9ARCH|nr:MAG: hypothetical protein B9J98_00170 [Candidatus Terraquivivens tikiterensis]